MFLFAAQERKPSSRHTLGAIHSCRHGAPNRSHCQEGCSTVLPICRELTPVGERSLLRPVPKIDAEISKQAGTRLDGFLGSSVVGGLGSLPLVWVVSGNPRCRLGRFDRLQP